MVRFTVDEHQIVALRDERSLRSGADKSDRAEVVRYSTVIRPPHVPIVQRPRTWPFQGQNTGSNPVGDAIRWGSIPGTYVTNSFARHRELVPDRVPSMLTLHPVRW